MELHARCICVCVELKCYSSGTSGSNPLDLFGSGLLCPCNLNFMCVFVCVYTSQFMYNTLYIYFLGENELGGSFSVCDIIHTKQVEFHFNLMIFGCPVWGRGGGQFSEASCYVTNIIVVCVFFGIVWRFRILTWKGSFSL